MKTISTLKQKVNLPYSKGLTINTLFKQNFSLKQTLNGTYNTKNFFRIKSLIAKIFFLLIHTHH